MLRRKTPKIMQKTPNENLTELRNFFEKESFPNYPLIARNANDSSTYGFTYNNLEFSQDSFHIIAGLNAVDNIENVNATFKKLNELNLYCARMGVYKPRTNPYSFQGLRDKCLPYVFESAHKYNIKIVAMEIMSELQLETVHSTLEKLGKPTGLLLQVGTRNAQNFELLKALGRQQEYPILFKRGFGISLLESLNAAEYIAKEGNNKIIFCLRGMKSEFAYPHRNFSDFSHVPVIKRLTKMPVCIDPSHAIGTKATDLHNIMDIMHANAQGIIAGTNMLLVDIHPNPMDALVDPAQSLDFHQFEKLVKDSNISRKCYLERLKL